MATYIAADTHGSEVKFESEPEDIFILVGDWEIGDIKTAAKKILVYGNHDLLPPEPFDFACDGLLLNHIWYTHEPAFRLPLGAHWNVCGHIHENNMNDLGYERKPWHILLPPNTVLNLDRVIMEKKHDPTLY